MHGGTRQTVFVDRDVLAEVERQFRDLVRRGLVSAVALIDSSGAILASAGDLPARDDEMGATAAGVFSAIRAVLPPMGPKEFSITVHTNNVFFHYLEVTERLFLCSFRMTGLPPAELRQSMACVAAQAKDLLADSAKRKPSAKTLSALNEKLEELFLSCKDSSRPQ